MPKVMHLITSLDSGGAEIMLSRLVTADKDSGWTHVVACLIPKGLVAKDVEQAGVSVTSLDMPRGRLSPSGLWRLFKLIRAEKPDVLMSWLYHSDMAGLVTAKWAGVPALAWNLRAAKIELSRYSRMTRLVLKVLAAFSKVPDVVVCNSQQAKDWHTELGYAPRRWEIIYNGFDLSRFKPDSEVRAQMRAAWGIPDDAKVIGHVARLDPVKDHASFIAAAKVIAKRDAHVHFVMAGLDIDEATPMIKDALHDPLLAGRLHALGFRRDVAQVMNGMDIIALTSISESFPGTLAEAMACGALCVATDVGDVRDILGGYGRVVPPSNVLALVEGVEALLHLPADEAEAMRAATIQRVRDHYSLDAMVKAYGRLFGSLLSKRRHTSNKDQ